MGELLPLENKLHCAIACMLCSLPYVWVDWTVAVPSTKKVCSCADVPADSSGRIPLHAPLQAAAGHAHVQARLRAQVAKFHRMHHRKQLREALRQQSIGREDLKVCGTWRVWLQWKSNFGKCCVKSSGSRI
eukprot:1150619-Pelagomonas_calceolata.AAC.4